MHHDRSDNATSPAERVGLLALVAGTYFLTGHLGLRLASLGDDVTLFWAPAGIGLGALLVGGLRAWPAVWIAAFLVNLEASSSAVLSSVIATGNVLEAIIGTVALRRFARIGLDLDRVRDAFAFILIGVLASPVIGATVGAACLSAPGAHPTHAFGAAWSVWWMGNAAGVLAVTPVLLSVRRLDFRRFVRPHMEAVFLTLALVLVAGFVWTDAVGTEPRAYPISLLPYPLLALAVLRFGAKGASLSALLLSTVAVVGTAAGSGPFVRDDVDHTHWLLWTYVIVTSSFSLLMSSALAERDREWREKRRLEERLRHSEKMEGYGQLAGGIAHDFNNLLTSILGYSELLAAELDEDSELRQDVEEIRIAGRRAEALTRKLLALGRQEMLNPQDVDLASAVLDMEQRIRSVLDESIRLSLQLDPTARPARIDPIQLEWVVMNLVLNARDAMPSGGELVLTTTSGSPPSEPTERHAELVVRDTGSGMDQTTQDRMFEPFFTTKDARRGTGLGLSIVHGIVSQSGGTLDVSSQPGAGTTVRIFLKESRVPVRTVPEQ